MVNGGGGRRAEQRLVCQRMDCESVGGARMLTSLLVAKCDASTSYKMRESRSLGTT